jgi:hypothetical protein
MLWSTAPILIYGLLQLPLAFAARTAGLGVTLAFSLAGFLILAGLWWSRAEFLLPGVLISLLTPIWMSKRLYGRPHWGHHLLRLLFAAASCVLWFRMLTL